MPQIPAHVNPVAIYLIAGSAILLLGTVFITYLVTNRQIRIDTDAVFEEYLQEAQKRLTAYGKEQRWFGRVSFWSLMFQYVIGATLAESFIQSQLNQRFVGWLGICVVGATIIRQVFKPEFRKQQADRKKAILQKAIRNSKALSSKDARSTLLHALNRVDDLEVADPTSQVPEVKTDQPPPAPPGGANAHVQGQTPNS